MKVQPSRMISSSGIAALLPPEAAVNPGVGSVGRMEVVDQLAQALWNAFQMAWEVWWALVLGFALSGIVQAWVPRERIERALGGRGAREVALSTGLGAASSSCSYAAIAIAKSMFAKG